MTPEQRGGKTANLVIFLGILYTILSLVALAGNLRLSTGGFGNFSLIVSLFVIALGYGIRYGSKACLYTTIGVFACFSGVTLFKFASRFSLLQLARFSLSTWTLYVLCRTLPALHLLQQTGSTPVKTSPYGDLFLKHWRK